MCIRSAVCVFWYLCVRVNVCMSVHVVHMHMFTWEGRHRLQQCSSVAGSQSLWGPGCEEEMTFPPLLCASPHLCVCVCVCVCVWGGGGGGGEASM